MDATLDISFVNLALGFLLMLIPLAVFHYYRTGLVNDTLIATFRMTLQLFLVGIYLEYLFLWNNGWINGLWMVLMVVVAAFTNLGRSKLKIRYFLIPVGLAMLIALVVVDAWFLGLVIRLDYVFESQYFIPITGMLLGNCMKTNVIALNSYFKGLRKDEMIYRYYLANGATRKEALAPYIRHALQESFNPNIAMMAVMGLIALPGTMTGQILGGSSPAVAIKYQIMLMITVFVSSMITVILTIWFSDRFAFESDDRLKLEIFR